MFNIVKFLLAFLMLITSSLSVAESCITSCTNEAKQYVDLSVSDEKLNAYLMCERRCRNQCFTNGTVAEQAQSLKGQLIGYVRKVCSGNSEQKDAERKERRALHKENIQQRLREMDRTHKERMDAINSQQNQAAAQASSQTSQNNYPSDSTSGQSRPDSSARHDNTNYANCISVTSEKNRYVVYKNNCSENLTLTLCQVSDGQGSEDNYSRFQDGGSCPSPGFGAIDIRAGAIHKKAEWFDFNNYRFFYYACKTGWIPVNESGKHVTRINESFLCKN